MSRLYPAIVPTGATFRAANWVRATAALTIPGSTSPPAGLASSPGGFGDFGDPGAAVDGEPAEAEAFGSPPPGEPGPEHPAAAASRSAASTAPGTRI
ncbi:hypothetical protein GCM10010425_72480 [Streptomyces spororaveus]|uniref:Uncharacterized protein n=1 Tax=Streptomyces spororaveus TaxID=284039 RepID=A0ABQ3T486_9ACTN|nr:hypothetical protein Sspor_07700 [Streptomyces spororaveus]